MKDVSLDRRPHAVLDLDSRQLKAEKIERLLGLGSGCGPVRLLEVGTGSGGIAHYFGCHPSGRYEVDAVDVVDSRLECAGFRYTMVSDTTLPFPDEHFDVVLSNHVIEHVGDKSQQRRHLDELRRVLRRDGRGYLAVPNRWMLVEPHYRLAFLSWLPRSLRSPYLRLAGRGSHYDCEPLTVPRLESLMAAASLRFSNVGTAALRATLEIEQPHSPLARLVARMPDAAIECFRRAIPTLIYVFERDKYIASRSNVS